jgi:hypothetical protein
VDVDLVVFIGSYPSTFLPVKVGRNRFPSSVRRQKRSQALRHYLLICISTTPVSDPLVDVPFFSLVEDSKPFPRQFQKTSRDRINYVADKKNRANAIGLTLYPDTTHILNIESYYMPQRKSIIKLVESYETLDNDNLILGAPTWFYQRNRVLRRAHFYDTWACPEMDPSPVYLLKAPEGGIAQVSSVGSCVIYPRWIWEKYGFHNPEPFPEAGIFYNYLFQKSGLPVLIDFRVKFWRSKANSEIPHSPWPQRLTTSAKHIVVKYRNLLTSLGSTSAD